MGESNSQTWNWEVGIRVSTSPSQITGPLKQDRQERRIPSFTLLGLWAQTVTAQMPLGPSLNPQYIRA